MRTQRLLFLWHRYMGLTVALFAAMLVITGWLLNHTDALGLDSRYVRSRLILDWYGIEAPAEALSFEAGGHWVSQLGDRLYLDGEPLAGHYDTPLIGAVKLTDLLVAAFAGQLLLLTPDGELIERLGDAAGVPSDMRGIGLAHDGSLLVQAAHGQYRTDAQFLSWQRTAIPSANWAHPVPTPDPLQERLASAYLATALPWERVVLDLHSGRILGPWGVWIIDFIALLMLLLAATGVWMWWMHRR